MITKANSVRSELGDLLGEMPEEYRKLLHDSKLSPRLRFDVMRDLMDRAGLPALRATLNKNMTVTAQAENLAQIHQELVGREQEVTKELEEVRQQLLEASHASEPQGEEGNGETVRQEEGGEGLLRLGEQAIPRQETEQETEVRNAG